MKKKFAFITALAALCLILSACPVAYESDNGGGAVPVEPWGDPPINGEFSGTGWGYFRDGVSMSFRMVNGVITDVEMDLTRETWDMVSRVEGIVAPLIQQRNSFDFAPNAVAGSTRTIEAIIVIGTQGLLYLGVDEEDIDWQWQAVAGRNEFRRPFPGQVYQ